MSGRQISLLVFMAVVVVIGSMSMFTVREDELAIKFKLGEFVRADYEPGLHWQWPFVNNVRKFDRRVQTLDAPPEHFLTSEKKNVIVDAFVKWRIADITTFYRTTSGGNVSFANDRLLRLVREGLLNEFGKRTIQEAISGERAEIMEVISEQFAAQAAQFGIEVVDVRIKRIELPSDVSASVYDRMRAERLRVANQYRAEGEEAARAIRANADRQVTEILAGAYRDAEVVRGEGDAKASAIYAEAYDQDPEFYSFYRSIDAYRYVLGKPQDVLVLDPNSEFFSYFKDPSGSRK